MPEPFSLLTPPDGATVNSQAAIDLLWEESVGAFTYRLDVATDPAFAGIAYAAPTFIGATIPAGTLAGGTLHYWRVEASDGFDTTYSTGAGGTFHTFTTAAARVSGGFRSRSRSRNR